MRHLAPRNPTQHHRLPTRFPQRVAHIKHSALAEFDLATRCRAGSNRQIHHHRSASLCLGPPAEPNISISRTKNVPSPGLTCFDASLRGYIPPGGVPERGEPNIPALCPRSNPPDVEALWASREPGFE